jgi:hypothetical protein
MIFMHHWDNRIILFLMRPVDFGRAIHAYEYEAEENYGEIDVPFDLAVNWDLVGLI